MSRLILAAFLASLMCMQAAAMLGPCDDGMNDSDIGADLRKVRRKGRAVRQQRCIQ